MKSTKAKQATRFLKLLPTIIDGDEGTETITADLRIELSASAWFIIATIARKRQWSIEDVIELTVDRHVEREAGDRMCAKLAKFSLS